MYAAVLPPWSVDHSKALAGATGHPWTILVFSLTCNQMQSCFLVMPWQQDDREFSYGIKDLTVLLIPQWVLWWHNGLGIGLAIKLLQFRFSVGAWLRNNSGQVVHTHYSDADSLRYYVVSLNNRYLLTYYYCRTNKSVFSFLHQLTTWLCTALHYSALHPSGVA